MQGRASCTAPRKASQATSPAVAWNGSASGRLASAASTAPSSTAGNMSRSRTAPARAACWSKVQLMAAASGTLSAIAVPT